jgi:cytochrome c oxidase subunit III
MTTEVLGKSPRPILDRGGPGGGGPGGEGDDRREGPEVFFDPARFGLWLFLGTLTMMFIGFTSAYMVRRLSPDWAPLKPPGLLWANTAVLLLSSGTLEAARRRLRGWNVAGVGPWLLATGALGALFVGGQLTAWRLLVARGYFVGSSPHNSFFYLLSGVHGLHLVVGLIWFAVVLVKARRLAYTPGEDGLGMFATYWHFLTGLWVYLLLLLFVF